MARPAWLSQQERGAPWAVRLILWIALHTGRAPARLLLWPITLYFVATGTQARHASYHYLARVLGRPARLREVVLHMHAFSATILDRVFFLSGQFERFDIRVHGAETLMQDRAQGVLLLSAHVGSFDALRALGVAQGNLPLRVLMYPEHNGFITGLLATLNSTLLDTIIPLGGMDSLLRVNEALQQGDMVGMLGDRVAESDKVVRCRFLNGSPLFPAGPALLATLTQTPTVLVFGLYRGGNRYDVYIEPFGEPFKPPRSEREAAMQQWMQRYADRLEHYVRLAPYNWFNFYDFWNDISAPE